MSQIIKIKSGTSGQPSSLSRGELAINVSSGAFYFGDAQSATTSNWFFSAASANTLSSTTITASGTITAEQITSTDDITASGNYFSGTTNLLDIFASSAITNPDVYWSANTDGSITNSGNTDIITTGTIRATSYNSTTSTSGYNLNGTKYLWRDGNHLQVGNTTGTVPHTDIIGLSINLQTATTINDNLTVVGSISASTSVLSPLISGVTLSASSNVVGATVSSTTTTTTSLVVTGDTTIGGNLAISGGGENYIAGDLNMWDADIVLPNNNSIKFENTSGTEFANIKMNTANDMIFQNAKTNGDILIRAGGSQSGDTIFTTNGAGTNTEIMRLVGDDAYVGIGTITPNEKLTVSGTVSASTSVLSPTVSAVTITSSGNVFVGNVDAAGAGYSENKILVAQSTGQIEYLTTAELKQDIGDADYWSGNTDGSISNSGLTTTKVGIGSNTPTHKLHVKGNSTSDDPVKLETVQAGRGYVLVIDDDGVVYKSKSASGAISASTLEVTGDVKASGKLTGATLDISGNADIDGTITGNLTGEVTGNASTATVLATARTIGGVSFNGSTNINLPGVNTAGNQNTSGLAATATILATARTIGGVSFDGSANIDLPGVNTAGNQDTSGNAATSTKIASITNSDIVQLGGAQTLTGTKTLNSFKGTGSVTVTNILDEDNMASNSATALVTQQSVKAYVDSREDADYWSANTDGSISTSGVTNVKLSGNTQMAGTLNVVGTITGDLTGDVTGNADTATILETARTIGGVSFNGSSNINLPGVNTAGNQNTSGNAATATILATARNIGGVSFNGSSNINLPGVNTAGNQDTSGTAAEATILETARNIGGVSFNGSANINLPGVNTDGNQDTSGNAATATLASTVTVTDNAGSIALPVVFHNSNYGLLDDTGTFTYQPSGGLLTVPRVAAASGISGNLTGNASTATILATARNIGGVSFDGSQNINLPGVNTAGNQNTSGNAATATLAADATTLATARTIGGVSFDGSANIDLPGVNTTGNQDTSGNAATSTKIASITNTDIVVLGGAQTLTGTKTLNSFKGTGSVTVTNILDEDNMASDSATALATQQSIKAYVLAQVGTADTLQEVTDNGNTTSNSIYLGENLGITGKTFFGGSVSGSGSVTAIGGFVGDVTGNASTATKLAATKTIGGVAFDGSSNINLPGVNTAGNQDTSGTAAEATILENARTIGGVSFNGSANIDLPGVNATGNQDTSGNAATATILATARDIGGVSFNGSANIDLPGVNTDGNQDTSGNAATSTKIASITNSNIVQLAGAQTLTGTKTLNSFKGTGSVTVTNILDEDNMASNSATALATQQSIKAYVDSREDADYWSANTDGSISTSGVTNVKISGNTQMAGTLNVVGTITGDLTGNVTGNADTATILETARNIGGVSFNGSGNINLPGVNTAGNQDTSGTAAEATILETARTIGGVSFDGSTNINLPGVNTAGNQNTSGVAATATILATARNIGGVSFNGSANIDLPGVNATGNQDTSGNASTATKIASITNSDIVQLGGAQTLTGTKTFNSFKGTGAVTVTNILDEDNMASNSATALATQQSIKAYVDVQVGGTSLWSANTDGSISTSGGTDVKLSGNTQMAGTLDVGGTITGDLTGDVTGNASTATILATARTIGGVSFNGSSNINLPGVNTAGNQNTSGNAATATILATARTIGGVSFDGSANINLPGVNTAGNQNTTGNADTATLAADATTLATARNIGGVSFDGSANIDLPGVNTAGNQNTSGLAATATILATARNIGGVSFNGSANINLPGVNTDGNQDTSGNAATSTKIASITNSDIVQLGGAQTLTGTKTLNSFKGTGSVTVTNILDEDNMASNSDTALATQQSIRAYVTSQVGASDTLQEVTDNGATTTNSITTAGLTSNGTVTVGVDDTGYDVKFFGDDSGEYMQWDTSEAKLKIVHTDESVGLEVYTNAAVQTTQPQLKVGRAATEYWGVYTEDRNAHLVHRQDETSGTMTTRFDQWDSNTSDTTGNWLWRFGNGSGGSMATSMTLTQAGLLTVSNVTGDLTGDVTGNADTATILATTRTIGGVSFNGSANINLPGVNTAGNQDTSGVAATATILATARNIGGVSFNGSANIDLPGVNTTGNQNTTGNADTATLAADATTLATARNIGGVSFDGSANIDLPGVNTSGNQDTSGNADTSTKIASITNSNIVQLGGAQTLTGTKTLNSFKGTGSVTVTNILDEDNMASNSATALATQQSIKAYVDASVPSESDTLQTVTSRGATSNVAITLSNDFTVGVNGTGHDVKFFGDTAGQYMLWDQSADKLIVTGEIEATKFDGALEGNADTATILATARNIGGVSFNGSANIDLPGVNTAGNQNTSGNAATTTILATARTIGGVSFDGSANIDLPGVNTAGNQNTSGLAATATILATARNIGGVSFNGSANIDLPGVNTSGNQDTSGNAATATKIASITNSDIVVLGGAQTLTGTKTLNSFKGTGSVTVTNILDEDNMASNSATALATQQSIKAYVDSREDADYWSANTDGSITNSGNTDIKTNGVIYADLTGDVTGNAATATILATARTIGGVSFNGSSNINLPGVNTTGNQNTSGLAATATILATARTIGGVSFNGSANIDLPGVNTAGNQNTSGLAATATILETARTIGGVSFNGSANIDLPGVNTAGNQDTSGNAATSTKIASITNSNIVQLAGAQTLTGTKTLNSFKGTGAVTVTNILDEDNMASNSATALATQQSIKAYVDSASGESDTLQDVTSRGATSNVAITLSNDLTVGVDDTGHDVKFFGATSGQYMLWDQSEDKLIVTGEIEATKFDGALEGNADTATKLAATKTIGGVAFDGSTNINLPGVNTAGNQNTSGLAATATILATARNIGGVSFNGSANIDLPGVNATGNQDTSGTAAVATVATTVTLTDESTDTTCFPVFAQSATGNAAMETGSNLTFNSSSGLLTATLLAGDLTGDVTGNADTATILATARTIGGVSFNGSANIDLPGVNSSGNQNTSGNAATATILATARNIGGVSFNGSANINLPGVNTAGNQDTSGNAATSTKIASITNSDIVQLGGAQTLTGTKTLNSFKGTGSVTVTNILDEDNMASNSATALVTQQSVKAYVDASVPSESDTLQDVTSRGATSNVAITLSNDFTVGADDTGHDVKFFGATSGQYMLWDQSADKLIVTGEIEATKFDGALEGNADTATILATARNIGGVSFNGSANIDLPGVNTAGNQDTSGNAATATILATARNIGGVSFNGSANINLPGVNTAGNQNTSGNAATATILATARTIGGVSFNGSANIDLPGVNSAGNQNTSGTAAIATTVTVTDESTDTTCFPIFSQSATGNVAMETGSNLTFNSSSGLLTATLLAGDLTGDVTGDVTGNASTATKLAATKTIGGVAFDGSANINLPGVNTAGNQNTSGLAATATILATARNIGGVSFNGSANINLPGVNTAGNQDTSGNAATATKIASITNSDIVQLAGAQTLTGTKTLNSFKGTGSVTVTNILDEDNMASNSATALVTQQSVKAYVDASIPSESDTLQDVTSRGATSNVAITLSNDFTVGVDDTGHDVKFFGATSGQYMLWDQSADKLIVTGEIEATKFDGALEGNADTATKLAATKTIGGVAFDGSANINLPGVNTAGNQNTSGLAATATILATARNIGGVSFNGSANIDLPGVNTAGNQDTSGNAATSTKIASITNSDIVQLSTTTTQTGTKTFSGVVDITNTTDSSDATGDTGALRTEGGASIAKKLYVGTDASIGGSKIEVADDLKIQTVGQTFPYIHFDADAMTLLTAQGETLTLGDNVSVNGNLLIASNLQHVGDDNNEISFGTDTQDFRTGNGSRLDISDSGVRLGGANSRVTTILDEDNMASDSATALATQQSIRAYVTSQVGASDTLQEVTDNGNTTSNSIYLGENLGITGKTFFGGSVSGTGSVTAIGGFVGDVTGNASTATKLAATKTIGGVAFDGSANINLPGVNTAGNQDTSGTAAEATILENARTIGGVSFNGSANIDLPGVNTAGNQNTSGLAATATILATARTIGGVSFNGSANIDLPGVNTTGNQNTSGNAATATVATTVTLTDESTDTTCFPVFAQSATGNVAMETGSNLTFNSSSGLLTATLLAGNLTGDVTGNADTATKLAATKTIGGVAFDGSANIDLPGVNTAGNQNTSGLAATATILATARTIGGVSFNGSANIDLPGVNTSGNQDTSGNAATATKIASITNSDIVVLGGAQTLTGTKTLNSFKGTGSVTVTNILDEDNMASNSATALATQQSIKAYVDASVPSESDTLQTVTSRGATSNVAITLSNTLTVGTNGTGHDVKFFGDTSGQYMLWDQSADELALVGDTKLSFHDAAGGENIVASSDGHLEINAGTTLDITAPTVQINASTLIDINGDADISGSLKFGATDTSANSTHYCLFKTTGAGNVVNKTNGYSFNPSTDKLTLGGLLNIEGQAGTISTTSGDITLDSAADIVIDAAGGNIEFKDAGTLALTIDIDSTAGDAIFKDAGSTEIFRIDGSADSLLMASGKKIEFGDSGESIVGDGTDLTIASGADILLNPTGEVGIGITTPITKLDVHHDPTGIASNTGGGEVLIGVGSFGEGIAQGMLVYLNASGVWTPADADAEASSTYLLGITLSSSIEGGVLIRGFFNVADYQQGTFRPGAPCYISEAAGSVDFTPPSASGDFVRIVGHATDTANVIYFNPSNDYIEIA